MTLLTIRNGVNSTCDFIENNLGLTGKLVSVASKWAVKTNIFGKHPATKIGETGEIVGNAMAFSKIFKAFNNALESVPAFLGTSFAKDTNSKREALLDGAVKDINDVVGSSVNIIRLMHATRFYFTPLTMAKAATTKAVANAIEGTLNFKKAVTSISLFNDKTTTLEQRKDYVDLVQSIAMIAVGVLPLVGVTYSLIALPMNATLIAGTVALVGAAISYLMKKRIEAERALICVPILNSDSSLKSIWVLPRSKWLLTKKSA